LESVLREAVIFSSLAAIDAREIEAALHASASESEKNVFSRAPGEKINLPKRMLEIEMGFIDTAVTEAGSETKAAELLGMKQQTLNRKKLAYPGKLKTAG
jgi:DNA-binding NtrC family response regulator